MEIKKEDYIEQCCPLDTYSHSARSAPSGKIPIKEVLKELDDLYSRERNADGSVLLEEWLKKAQEIGDWSGELSIYSELMGHHRRTGDKEKGLDIKVPYNYFPDDDPKNPPVQNWRSHATLLYTNWLNYFVYQITPYDLAEINK